MRLKAAAILAALACIQCREQVRTHNWFAMNTNLAATLYGPPQAEDDAIFAVLEAETARLDAIFTYFSLPRPCRRSKAKVAIPWPWTRKSTA